VKKESNNSSSLLKKKSKDHLMVKSQKVKYIETAPLISASISKKKKQSLKFLL